MTVLANFDIAQDLKVQMYLPLSANNVFVLGISKLDGPNVLGDDNSGTYGWRNLEVEVNKVVTGIGGSVASNVFFQAAPGSATINMQSWTFDPTNNPFIRPGVLVKIVLQRGLYSRAIWSGVLGDINVDYAPNQPNQITINAVDPWSAVTNRRFDYDPTGLGTGGKIYPSQAIEVALNQLETQSGPAINYTPSVSSADEWFMTETAAAKTTFGTVMSNVLNSGLGFVWIDPDDAYLKYRARAATGTATYSVGNNHGDTNHLCMVDISVATGSDDLYNNVLVQQKEQFGAVPKFQALYKDSDLIELYGERSSDFTVDLAETADANRWASALFVPRSPTHVQQVVIPTIDRLSNLTEAAIFMPGEFIAVDFVTDELDIQETYTITRVRHNIDVNNWFTTLELWKEF